QLGQGVTVTKIVPVAIAFYSTGKGTQETLVGSVGMLLEPLEFIECRSIARRGKIQANTLALFLSPFFPGVVHIEHALAPTQYDPYPTFVTLDSTNIGIALRSLYCGQHQRRGHALGATRVVDDQIVCAQPPLRQHGGKLLT